MFWPSDQTDVIGEEMPPDGANRLHFQILIKDYVAHHAFFK